MKRLTRDIFIEQTCRLLNERGRTDFALSDVLDSCGAKKGSLYHFFPEGKHELVVAAVKEMSACALAHVESCLTEEASIADAVFRQVSDLARLVETPGRPIAIPFSAIAAITGDDDEAVRLACQNALKSIEAMYTRQLKNAGVKVAEARSIAAFIVVAIEGAFLVSRTRRSGQPLRLAAQNLRDYVDRCLTECRVVGRSR